MKPTVKLIGKDGNIFAMVAKAMKTMKKEGISKETIREFQNKTFKAKNYDEALGIIMEYVEIE